MSALPESIYFAGAGGSGVSALAVFMAQRGYRVSGSDRAFDQSPAHPLIQALGARGITLHPDDGSGLTPDVGLLVASTAVEPTTPIMKRAAELGVPVMHRPEFLSLLVSEMDTIAIAGTSGKSTASGMLAFVLKRLGLEPNFIGGGRVRGFPPPGNALTGTSGTLVIEACESDGSIVQYRPATAVLLNLALDHQSIEETASLFDRFADNTSGPVILDADDEHLRRLSVRADLTYSLNSPSDIRATDVRMQALRSSFSALGQGFTLNVPGAHNIRNALAVIATAQSRGLDLKRVAAALGEFQGIERRFQIYRNDLASGGPLVLDDYAHNPHKIAALMQTMQRIADSVCYVFQPHGFGPTRLMRSGYAETFSAYLRPADHLFILPIFYAGGTAAKDISSADLAADIGGNVHAPADRKALLASLPECEAYAVLGARDDSLSSLAQIIAELFS